MNTRSGKQHAPRFTWSTDDIWKLIGSVEKEENRKVLLGLRATEGENTTGDSKTTVYKRIGVELFLEEVELATEVKEKKAVASALGIRVKGKWESLTGSYKEHASTMIATGGGLKNLRDEQLVEALQNMSGTSPLYVPPEGPTGDTIEEGRNLWEDINKKFPFFGRLHSLVATRPNMNLISITTGARPLGATTIRPQPASPGAYAAGAVWSDGLDHANPTQSIFDSSDLFSSQQGLGLEQLSSTQATATPSSLSSPAGQLATPKPTPAVNQTTTKGKKAYKPQPPKVSSLSKTAIKKAAQCKLEKKGLEEVLVRIHKSNASMVVRRLKEETRLKHNDQILARYNAGLLTKDECQAMLGLGNGESSGKKRKATDGDERSRMKKRRSPSPSDFEFGSAWDEGNESGTGLGSEDSGENEEDEERLLYGSP